MNYDRPRVDWLYIALWVPFLLAGCGILAGALWLLQRIALALDPFVRPNIDGIVSVIVMAGVAAIFVMTRKDGKR